MKKYKYGGQLDVIVCNCCGRKIVIKDAIAREGFAAINLSWDFFSEKDGEVHHFDLCEECYDDLTSQFKIPIDIEERAEYL